MPIISILLSPNVNVGLVYMHGINTQTSVLISNSLLEDIKIVLLIKY